MQNTCPLDCARYEASRREVSAWCFPLDTTSRGTSANANDLHPLFFQGDCDTDDDVS